MHLIEIFLPISDNEGDEFPRSDHEAVERELTAKFGGVTAYPRAPASGRWKPSGTTPDENAQRDDLIIYEVMADSLDRAWWTAYRRQLEATFRQEKIVIRAQSIEML